ncbi:MULTISPECIES: phosphoadenylyl-sulfate reductase [Asaia]|uniref:Adenosine 5'-phosphosulfate reductase n=2 Tax=Asaia bogorensis TaxID=91915 RepID=A0AAN4R078_9PROT|nr:MULTISPECIES: phosphoadenylyl-sulfate reductase [Asaia]ETC97654.1 phosphoadenosine phosphosulfate reductase [Asaia sp. SF2.1]CDG41195.1 Phosphoadenylyl-sulfate reductase [thioredoxin] / Adenylyl-sulfate reductase [thioredoxin] [Asaia bogorensis]BAT20399.1 phosphoadenosine phosphosulfate reductase [Asaia bogorensis NBRC 16594]GBQ79461.1 phosphoadenosine phosphosulfate reductase [Asaia bogorensis NBRC 16594]GEL52179.1 phosphoadenylyl-sulfate reductase (thioredoxin) [Asaia bogorensis NBRC 1659
MALTQTERQILETTGEEAILERSMEVLSGRMALVSSFGAESALLLALVADIDRDFPIFFLDTKRHFPETLSYRDALIDHLGLTGVVNIAPSAKALHDRDPQDMLADFDPDACCALRKVEPMDDALNDFDAWITGRKRGQAATRASMAVFEPLADGRAKINPLASWTRERIASEMTRRDLPRHPLTALGFKSIGCAPCTRAVAEGEDPRAGRWAGQTKTECGIHLPAR